MEFEKWQTQVREERKVEKPKSRVKNLKRIKHSIKVAERTSQPIDLSFLQKNC